MDCGDLSTACRWRIDGVSRLFWHGHKIILSLLVVLRVFFVFQVWLKFVVVVVLRNCVYCFSVLLVTGIHQEF